MNTFVMFFASAANAATPSVPPAIGFWPVVAGGVLLVVLYFLQKISRQLDTIAERLVAAPRLAAPLVESAPVAVRNVESSDAGPTPETIAVIAAAVHVALGRPVRIVAIADGGESARTWSMEGRRQIFASHQFR